MRQLTDLERAVQEQQPDLRLVMEGDSPSFRGSFQLANDGVVFDRFSIRITFPDGAFKLPQIEEIGGRIPRHIDRHVFGNGAICTEVPELTLLRAGQLEAFCHSEHSATRMKTSSNGRGGREADGSVSVRPHRLTVLPGNAPMPADGVELVARFEPFTTGARKGVLSLFAAGYEWRAGQRSAATGLFELRVPVLAAFRTLLAVGADSQALPTADGVQTPTLAFDGLLSSAVLWE